MSDLSQQEQENVRVALRFLRARTGTWVIVAKALRATERGLRYIIAGGTVTASIAVRAARLASVGVDDVLTGAYPPAGTCPHCGCRPANDATGP